LEPHITKAREQRGEKNTADIDNIQCMLYRTSDNSLTVASAPMLRSGVIWAVADGA